MTSHKIGTREEWLAARLELLEAEKALTRRTDDVARQRQELPWVRIDKQYRFDTDEGPASLADLFRGRSQLLVYHFMFGPDYTAGCPSCSAIADGFSGSVVHLAHHDVTLTAVSRAPLAKIQAYKRRMGWSFPFASSYGSDFNYDFQVGHTKEAWDAGAVEYNFRVSGPAAARRRGEFPERLGRGDRQHGLGNLPARRARDERVRARGRRRVPHLLGVRARARRGVGHVPVARPRPARPQRDRPVVAPPRRVRHAMTRARGFGFRRWRRPPMPSSPRAWRPQTRSPPRWRACAGSPTTRARSSAAHESSSSGLGGNEPRPLASAERNTTRGRYGGMSPRISRSAATASPGRGARRSRRATWRRSGDPAGSGPAVRGR